MVKNINPPTIPKQIIIIASGAVNSVKFDNDDFDQNTVEMGSAYHTQAEALKARDKQLATVRVLNKLRELEGDWVVEWDNPNQFKYRFFYQPFDQKVGIDHSRTTISIDPQFYSSESAWQWVLENMYADLKLMWGIE